MKVVNVFVPIQMTIGDDEDISSEVHKVLDLINQNLNTSFELTDVSPQILTGGIDESDIVVQEENNEARVLKIVMERYGSLATLKMAMYEDSDVVEVNIADDLNDEIDGAEILDIIHKLLK